MRDAQAQLNALGTAVLGISPDPPAAQKKFSEALNLAFPLLSDMDHSVAMAYGVWGKKTLYGKKYFGIIRSAFLGKIREAYDQEPGLDNLLLDPYFREKVMKAQEGWRRVVAAAVMHGIPVPALSSALSYFDGYRCDRLPANLLQAQRDYFGAHTYERTDKPRGMFFHTNWTGRGGDTASTTYNA